MNPLKIKRDGTVIHRATGIRLGEVRQVPKHYTWRHDAGMWISYSHDHDASNIDEFHTRWEAAEDLLSPLNQLPTIDAYICIRCRNRLPRPPPSKCPTGECETPEQAEKRCRLEDPMKWAVYDFVCSLIEKENK